MLIQPTALATGSIASTWDVFLLFAIPIGGGIPAGVVLAQKQGIGWLTMTIIYLLSDIALALAFEPCMRLFLTFSEKSKFAAKIREILRKSTELTLAGYGAKPGPFLLMVIAFGVDPMTGRTAALTAGHGFITGWMIAILGDMLFFGLVAASTICLNNILGDGTWTAVIIMALMIALPPLIRRIKKTWNPQPSEG